MDRLFDYELIVYICQGTNKEKREWFEIVNIGGEVLTTQELRNATYTGTWLSDAKRYFSKQNCAAYKLGGKFITDIDEYMTRHQHDNDADELWQYYQDVIHWIQKVFIKYRQEMKGLDWFSFYNKYKDNKYNANELKKKTIELFDDDVTTFSGIYPYLLSGDEKYLSIRQFEKREIRAAYERQKGICPRCGKHYETGEMHADHITPWSKGGKTVPDNCQMLCADCNRRKSNI